MKKVLVSVYDHKNFGDDLFLKILFDRYKDVEWVIETSQKQYYDIFSNYNNVKIEFNIFYRILRKLKLLKILRNRIYFHGFDAFILIGGSIFMELPEWKVQFKERIDTIEKFNYNSKKVFIIGANFGPYKNKEFYDAYYELFKKCDDVCLRDKYSYELFEGLENVRLAPDIVFQLGKTGVQKIKNSVGVSLVNIEHREGLKEFNSIYINKMSEMVEKLIINKKNVTFFSFCEEEGDKEIIDKVIKHINPQYVNKINAINYEGNIEEFLEQFESMENIIGSRFHSCILSQVFDQGLYPLIYSDKTYNVLKDIGLDKEYTYINKISELDIDNLIKKINNNKIENISIFKEAQKQFDRIDEYVNK